MTVRIKVYGEYAHAVEAEGDSLLDCLEDLAKRGDADLQTVFRNLDPSARIELAKEQERASELASIASEAVIMLEELDLEPVAGELRARLTAAGVPDAASD